MAWNNNPIRRGQLVMPFGPGNLFVSKNGTSLIIGGIDHWFDNKVSVDEFIVRDWRLEAELGLDELRVPPDYRSPYFGQTNVNTELSLPALRFPQYHVCSNCKLLQKKPLEQAQYAKCAECGPANKPHRLNQVRFITICEKGHIQDFPWREWVHKSAKPSCDGGLYYRAGSGSSLDNISISCDKCKASEKLTSSIFNAVDRDGVVVSSSLQSLIPNLKCKGMSPWLGDSEGSDCDSPPIGALRGAGNVYFPITSSSLSLPKSKDVLLQSIIDEIENDPNHRNHLVAPKGFWEDKEDPKTKEILDKLLDSSATIISQRLGCAGPENFEEIKKAMILILNEEMPQQFALPENRGLREIAFRRQEYKILQEESSHENLIIEKVDIEEFDANNESNGLMDGIDSISLVKKLIETTVLQGFSRLNPRREDAFKADLMLEKNKHRFKWLPARQSTGEGIFIRFNETILQDWEKREVVLERVRNLQKNISQSKLYSKKEGLASARHILIHTFAHCLINELTYSSGYSSSALRERLYISNDPEFPMSGVLIYTSSGDSEGSMGGLVQQGRPNTFEKLLNRALTKTSWCSHDPVCAIGKDTGPDSCNNSACYSCALVPEPSCEHSNAGLDRALLGARATGYDGLAYFIPLEER